VFYFFSNKLLKKSAVFAVEVPGFVRTDESLLESGLFAFVVAAAAVVAGTVEAPSEP
jgi:hypothetical protein